MKQRKIGRLEHWIIGAYPERISSINVIRCGMIKLPKWLVVIGICLALVMSWAYVLWRIIAPFLPSVKFVHVLVPILLIALYLVLYEMKKRVSRRRQKPEGPSSPGTTLDS